MKRLVIFTLVVAVTAAAWFWASPRNQRTSGPLPHAAYVWQRVWTDPVRQSIAAHSTNFASLIVLNAEASWNQGQPVLTRVPVDYATLRNAGRPVGLALRIGAFGGPFAADNEPARWLADLAASLLAEAASNQLAIAELQLDFDCADSKLDGYRVWVETIRQRTAPVPLTITALPSWLKQPAFRHLVAMTDGYVLQVHSVERPKGINAPFSLCDPAMARAAVERAGRIGVPFHVALPTYGYLMAFDRSDHFIGLSAEGPSMNWPDDVRLREVRTDPAAMAGLVAGWMKDRPASLHGVIWYRLPILKENLNWRWATLSEVLAGRVPLPDMRAEVRAARPALVEIDLFNAGQADQLSSVQVALRWRAARLVACDGLNGFASADTGTNVVRFTSKGPWRLAPGDRRNIGWLRFDQEAEVQIEVSTD